LDLEGGATLLLNLSFGEETDLSNVDFERVRATAIPCRTALVLGGARSGKSRLALAMAEAAALERRMIATAEALDEEMTARIARHKRERGVGWSTSETPLDLTAALRQEAKPGRSLLVDCVTLWLSNVMLAGRDVEAAIAELAEIVPTFGCPVIFVSNEVGSGVTPASQMGREFQDHQGRANQALARACDVVVAVTAGLPRLLKPAPAPWLRFESDC
jgi:adenosylcobinamide kinase/adenosylcobinamide-phosphate guanylyltransferase